MSAHSVFQVGAGTHTIDVVLDYHEVGSCTIQVGRGRLTAEVVPLGSTGQAATAGQAQSSPGTNSTTR